MTRVSCGADVAAEDRNPGCLAGLPGRAVWRGFLAGLRVGVAGINRETPSGLVRKWQDRWTGTVRAAEATNHPSVAWAKRQRGTLPGPEGSGCAIPARLRAW